MEPPRCENIHDTDAVSCQPIAQTVTSADSLDISKVNDLLDFVKARLISGPNGNLKLYGSRVSNDSRHAALQEVVDLNRLLEDVKGLLERKTKTPAMNTAQETLKLAKSSAIPLASIREVIKEELEPGMRDLRVENERLQDRALKVEERGKAVENEGAALKESMRKLASGQAKGVRAFVKEETARCLREMLEQTKLKDRMAKAEKDIAHAAIDMEDDLQALESKMIDRIASAVLGIKHDLKKDISGVETTIRSQVERLRRDSGLLSSGDDESDGEGEAGNETSVDDDGKPADFDNFWPVKVGQ